VRIAALSVFVVAVPVGADDLVPLPPHPAGLPWPTDSFPTGQLPRGLDTAVFERSVSELFESKGRGGFADTRALLIVRGGELVFERYAEGFGPESRFLSWSMAKSVTSGLLGRLVAEGRLALDTPAPVQAWQSDDDPRRAITLDDLLQMRTGLDNGDGFGSEDLSKSFISKLLFGEGSASPAAYAADVPLAHPIGQHWAYSTGSSVLLASICGDVIGGGAVGTRDYLRRELFEPIGMRSAQPEFAVSGEFIGGAFVYANARDWARFGYL
jgi:CubicO group peptidase (beta-lactamase class C family)